MVLDLSLVAWARPSYLTEPVYPAQTVVVSGGFFIACPEPKIYYSRLASCNLLRFRTSLLFHLQIPPSPIFFSPSLLPPFIAPSPPIPSHPLLSPSSLLLTSFILRPLFYPCWFAAGLRSVCTAAAAAALVCCR